MASGALEATGLKKPSDAPTEITLSIQPGSNLNMSDGTAASAVTKIYYLKGADTWNRLTMQQMLSDEETKTALGDELVASREVILAPRRPYTHKEKVPKEARYIGVATFFFDAAPNRWKYVFDVKQAADTGIVLGAHACALSVPTGQPIMREDMPRQDPKSLAFVQCGS
jgi:type VI secretion system protein VasD